MTRPFDVLVEEAETTGQSSGTPSPDAWRPSDFDGNGWKLRGTCCVKKPLVFVWRVILRFFSRFAVLIEVRILERKNPNSTGLLEFSIKKWDSIFPFAPLSLNKSKDSQTFFKCSTKAVATDTDDLLCTAPGPQVQPDALTAPEGPELKQGTTSCIGAIGHSECKAEPLAEAEKLEMAAVPIVPVQPEGENGQENGGKNGKVIELTDSKADSKAGKVQVPRDRSTSVPKRVQILPPRPSSISAPTASPPAARCRTSSVKERPRMATQLHIPVSARLSSRRAARSANAPMEKSFSARELSRCLADVGGHDFLKYFFGLLS